jgi:beta-glucosidase-like glycosyl hydrolase
MAAVDESVRRVLRVKFAFGLFENPHPSSVRPPKSRWSSSKTNPTHSPSHPVPKLPSLAPRRQPQRNAVFLGRGP